MFSRGDLLIIAPHIEYTDDFRKFISKSNGINWQFPYLD